MFQASLNFVLFSHFHNPKRRHLARTCLLEALENVELYHPIHIHCEYDLIVHSYVFLSVF